jgi:hypothetical protein
MGCESKRIGVAELLEFPGVGAGELFTISEHRGERDDAGDEVAGVACVCEMRRAVAARRFRADSCDLTAAHRDPEAQAVLDIEDEKLELETQRGIEEELAERFWISRDVRELRHALAQHLGALAKRVAGEEGAQDDPDQLHGSQYKAAADPG